MSSDLLAVSVFDPTKGEQRAWEQGSLFTVANTGADLALVRVVRSNPSSLLHTSNVSTIASTSARTFTLEHKRHKQGGSYLALTIALTFCHFTLEDFWHKHKRKTSTKKPKVSFFLRLQLRFSRFALDFSCVAIAIALVLTLLVWSRCSKVKQTQTYFCLWKMTC